MTGLHLQLTVFTSADVRSGRDNALSHNPFVHTWVCYVLRSEFSLVLWTFFLVFFLIPRSHFLGIRRSRVT